MVPVNILFINGNNPVAAFLFGAIQGFVGIFYQCLTAADIQSGYADAHRYANCLMVAFFNLRQFG